MTNPPKSDLIAIGMPKGSSPTDSVDERLGLHLLETLEALASVYSSANFFAGLATDKAIVDYTLSRCLECVEVDQGAVFVVRNDGLELHSMQGDVVASIDVVALESVREAMFCNGPNAAKFLRCGANMNMLLAPIATDDERLGMVVVLSPPSKLFATLDVKLASAVTSQAAIALRSAIYYRDVEIERRKLRSIIDQHSEGIIVLDANGSTQLCNPAARCLCGVDERVGEPFARLTAAFETAEIDYSSLLVGDFRDEVTFQCDGEPRIVSVVAKSVRDGQGELVNVIIALRDLTEQRREERLKRDFVSLLSHKFRTPITAILGALMLMEEETMGVVERGEFVTEVSQRTRELEVLVNRLLLFSEVLEGSWSTRGESSLCEIAPSLQEETAQRFGHRGLRMEWDLADDEVSLSIPAALLRIVLENLIENAVKFGPADDPWVRVTSRLNHNAKLVVEVEDLGPGIAARDREKVFSSFHQPEDNFTGNVPGVGIGLAMAAAIVERVGGTIAFRDRVPRGTVFTVTVPQLDRTSVS